MRKKSSPRLSAAELRSWLESLKAEEERLTLERARAAWVMDEAQTRLLVELHRKFDEAWEAEEEEIPQEVESAWKNTSTLGQGLQAMAETLQERLHIMFSSAE